MERYFKPKHTCMDVLIGNPEHCETNQALVLPQFLLGTMGKSDLNQLGHACVLYSVCHILGYFL